MHHYVHQFGGFRPALCNHAANYTTTRCMEEAGVEQVCYVKNVLIKSPYHTAK